MIADNGVVYSLSKKMVKCQLQCQSGKVFEVDVEAIEKSATVKNMLDDLSIGKDPSVEVDPEVIPLPNISEPCMEKIVRWCTQHKDDPIPQPPAPGEEDLMIFNDEIGEWDADFLKMEDSTLFDLILASNYLNIKGLLDLTTTHVAHMIVEARTPEGIRRRFNIKNDLTTEDLKKIEQEAMTWLDSDSDDDDEKKKKDKGEDAGATASASASASATGGAEGGSPIAGTSRDDPTAELSPLRQQDDD